MTTAIAEAKRELHDSYRNLVLAWARGEQSFSPGESEHTITGANLPLMLTTMGRTFPEFERDVATIQRRDQWAEDVAKSTQLRQQLQEMKERSISLNDELKRLHDEFVARSKKIGLELQALDAKRRAVMYGMTDSSSESSLRAGADPRVQVQIDALHGERSQLKSEFDDLLRRSEVRDAQGHRLRLADLESRAQQIEQELQFKTVNRDDDELKLRTVKSTARDLAKVEQSIADNRQQQEAVDKKIEELRTLQLDPACLDFLR